MKTPELAARVVRTALIVGLVVAALEFAVTRVAVATTAIAYAAWFLRLALHWTLDTLPYAVFLAFFERRSPDHRSASGYALVVLVGAVLGACVMMLHGRYVDPTITRTAVGYDMALPDRFLYGLWTLAFWCSLSALLHGAQLRERGMNRALHRAELARLVSERRLAETRVQALQAQVEPEFMLSTLKAVGHLFETDPAAADRTLDALIQFLREATPKLRERSATLGEECRLLARYLRVVGAAVGRNLAPRIEAESGVDYAALPSGTLIALVQPLVGSTPPPGIEPAIVLRAGRRGRALEVDLECEGCTPAADLRDCVARLDDRFRAVCGTGAGLQVLCKTARGITLRATLFDPREAGDVQSQGS